MISAGIIIIATNMLSTCSAPGPEPSGQCDYCMDSLGILQRYVVILIFQMKQMKLREIKSFSQGNITKQQTQKMKVPKTYSLKVNGSLQTSEYHNYLRELLKIKIWVPKDSDFAGLRQTYIFLTSNPDALGIWPHL